MKKHDISRMKSSYYHDKFTYANQLDLQTKCARKISRKIIVVFVLLKERNLDEAYKINQELALAKGVHENTVWKAVQLNGAET